MCSNVPEYKCRLHSTRNSKSSYDVTDYDMTTFPSEEGKEFLSSLQLRGGENPPPPHLPTIIINCHMRILTVHCYGDDIVRSLACMESI